MPAFQKREELRLYVFRLRQCILIVGDAVGHIGDGQMYTLMGGVTVQWDIGSAARAAANRADANLARLEAERTELDRELQGAAISAAKALVRARKRVELSQVAVDVAAEILRSVIDRARAQSGDRRFLFAGPRDELTVEADAVLFDLVLGGLLWPFLRKHWLHHAARALAEAWRKKWEERT